MKRRTIWVLIGVVLGSLGAILAWANHDPWPARVVFRPPAESWPVGFAADGRTYRTVGEPGSFAWDVATGEPTKISLGAVINQKRLTADGRSFVGTRFNPDTPGLEVVWGEADSESIRAHWPITANNTFPPAWEQGEQAVRIVLINRNRVVEVVTWDLATGSETRRTLTGPVSRPGVRSTPQGVSPDGRTLAYFNLKDNSILLWDTATDQPIGEPLRSPTARLSGATAATFTPDGRTLIVNRDDGRAEFWDWAEGRLLRSILVHPDEYYSNDIQFSPDGRTLASAGQNPHHSSRLAWAWGQLYQVAPTWFRQSSWKSSSSTSPLVAPWPGRPGRSTRNSHPMAAGSRLHEADGSFSIRSAPHPSPPDQ